VHRQTPPIFLCLSRISAEFVIFANQRNIFRRKLVVNKDESEYTYISYTNGRFLLATPTPRFKCVYTACGAEGFTLQSFRSSLCLDFFYVALWIRLILTFVCAFETHSVHSPFTFSTNLPVTKFQLDWTCLWHASYATLSAYLSGVALKHCSEAGIRWQATTQTWTLSVW